jgi:hypothetical protein
MVHVRLHERLCFLLLILSERKETAHRSTRQSRNLSPLATVDRIGIV